MNPLFHGQLVKSRTLKDDLGNEITVELHQIAPEEYQLSIVEYRGIPRILNGSLGIMINSGEIYCQAKLKAGFKFQCQ